jgi:hypothetical protein
MSCCAMIRRTVLAIAAPPNMHCDARRIMSTAAMYEEMYASSEEYTILDVGQYLSDVEQVLQPRPIRLNETLRKCMLRTLTGVQDIDQQVRELKEQLQWEKAICFAQTHLAALEDARVRKAAFFQSGTDPRSHFRNPAKWFSCMATGREFQGNFNGMLCNIAPESIAEYTKAVQEIDEKQVQVMWIEGSDIGHKQAAISCVEMDFPKQWSTSDGVALGRQSESRLLAFLHQQMVSDNQRIIVENILVKPRATKGQKVSTIFVCEAVSLPGMTSEFDCMVVERDGEWIRIHEVWEAKATLQPSSIFDASVKKFSALTAILLDDTARFILNDEQLRLHKEIPLFGLFGSSIHSPISAARRINSICCQRLLSQDVNAVLEALETGHVMVTEDELLKGMECFRVVLDRVKPVIAVPRLLNDNEGI